MPKINKKLMKMIIRSKKEYNVRDGNFQVINDDYIRIYHNGELIFKYGFGILHIYGDSQSDANAIYTGMNYCKIPYTISKNENYNKNLVEKQGNWYLFLDDTKKIVTKHGCITFED